MAASISVLANVGAVAGETDETIGPYTDVIPNPVGELLELILPLGDTTLAVPAGATDIIITLPAANGVQVLLKRQGSDAGIELALAGTLKLSINPLLCTQIILNAAALMVVPVQIAFE